MQVLRRHRGAVSGEVLASEAGVSPDMRRALDDDALYIDRRKKNASGRGNLFSEASPTLVVRRDDVTKASAETAFKRAALSWSVAPVVSVYEHTG